jgi:flagellar hook-associated protein 2
MPSISSLGVGSGLELGNLVDKLVQIERQSVEGPLNRRQAKAELTLSAIGSLRSSVSSLIGAVSALNDVKIGRSVESSFPEAVSATATATADIGTYLINVSQIAVAQSLSTDGDNPFDDADASLGEGTLTVATGNGSIQIDLSEGQDSLRSVRDAINASGLGIQAALLQDGDQYHLLLTSGTTGTDGEMSMTVTGTVDPRLASANMDITTAAQDAVYSVNGLSLSSSSNTIEGVLPDVTVELKAETGGDSVALDVVSDTQGLGEKLEAVVGAYNALTTNMSALGGASPDGSQAGPLVGDASLRALQRQIGSIFSTNLSSDMEGNPFSNLVGIGVHKELSGAATLNAVELKKALELNEGGVQSLVASFAASFSETLKAYDGSGGILTHRVNRLNEQLNRIGSQREDLERRMSETEQRLVARFSALDALVAQFNNTSTFLTQQLASIASIANYRRNNN